MTIGQKIRQARIANEMSQIELSIEADVNQGTISRYERDMQGMRLTVLERIAKALGMNVRELLDNA